MNNVKGSIIDVNENDFIEKVINSSENQTVVVDFWAPWCGPCKQLTPMLESVIEKYEGKVILAKINIDENQQIASQLRIQSIPTVMAFKDKKILDAFQGVIPENKIIEFIEKVSGESVKKDFSNFYEEIQNLIKEKKLTDAILKLEEHIAENSSDANGIALYLNCLIDQKKFKEAKDFLSSLSEEILKSPEILSVKENLKIKESNKDGESISFLEDKYKKDPKNLDLALELSKKHFANNNIEESFNLLISTYIKQNEKNKQVIKKTILSYFSALGDDDENTKLYRKKFSSIMFS